MLKTLHYVVSWSIRLVLALLCRIDSHDLRRIPREGPCILVTNHINFLEVPILYTHLMPRRIAALVKKENWDNPFLGFLGNIWQGIPIARGVVDRKAITDARAALDSRAMLFIAPEGTRSGNGKLGRGSSGVTLLAANNGVPVFPIAHHGGEHFWRNVKSVKRTKVDIHVGKPFTVETGGLEIDRRARRRITDEIMRRIAELLPEVYRGYYDDHLGRDYEYLKPV